MSNDSNSNRLSRRHFLAVAGGLTIVIAGAAVVPGLSRSKEDNTNGERITAWVNIQPDGKITIYNPAAEMGQGSMTALAIIIAEELDADWNDVAIEHSPIEPDVYGLSWRGGLGGPMITVGSRTVMGYYEHLRMAGAQARYVLMANASKKWGVPIEELTTGPSKVLHQSSGKSISYGEISRFATAPDKLPDIDQDQLKSAEEFRLIGKVTDRHDIPSKVDGTAEYAMDINVPDMLHAVISRSPVHGSKPDLQNESDLRTMEGIVDIVILDHGVGILAQKIEQALKAKRFMQIKWSEDGMASGHDSQAAYEIYDATSRSDDTNWHSIVSEGSVEDNLSADDVIEARFKNDYVYHAQMEPLNALVSPPREGDPAEVWVGSQAQAGARQAAAEALNLPEDQVILHPCYLGGGFGRRSMADYVTEAALLAKHADKPVKLLWTREDDLQYGAFRPICSQTLQAKVKADGTISAWSHRIVGTGGGLLGSGARIPYYTMDAKRVEMHSIEHGVRTKHWRSVAHGPNKFAIEAFIDEIARKLGFDPYLYRRRLMINDQRSLAVLDAAAAMCDWNSPAPEGRARGIAFAERSGALAAGVAEISVDRNTGMIKVHHFWAAVDAGVVVQPHNAIAQIEGGIVFGISSVLRESITFKDGKVQQSNFHDYPIARMADTPDQLEVKIIPSDEKPAGIGEASTPLVGGAIANAFLALTGNSLRHMPFTSERVLEVLS